MQDYKEDNVSEEGKMAAEAYLKALREEKIARIAKKVSRLVLWTLSVVFAIIMARLWSNGNQAIVIGFAFFFIMRTKLQTSRIEEKLQSLVRA